MVLRNLKCIPDVATFRHDALEVVKTRVDVCIMEQDRNLITKLCNRKQSSNCSISVRFGESFISNLDKFFKIGKTEEREF